MLTVLIQVKEMAHKYLSGVLLKNYDQNTSYLLLITILRIYVWRNNTFFEQIDKITVSLNVTKT